MTDVGDGTRGRDLDEALTTEAGDTYVEDDRVVWQPSSELDPDFQDYFRASLEQLNVLIDQGVIEIDADGNIRPQEG